MTTKRATVMVKITAAHAERTTGWLFVNRVGFRTKPTLLRPASCNLGALGIALWNALGGLVLVYSSRMLRKCEKSVNPAGFGAPAPFKNGKCDVIVCVS